MRDYNRLPLRDLRKRELRELVADMRLRHADEIEAILDQLPPEKALDITLARCERLRPTRLKK